ncbi:MAG TPA: glycosyltransferase [Ktedonobacteraceae bacterium]|jgi:glycosyltransferase involved in cell wall biosynthesis
MRIVIVTDQYPPMVGGVPTVTRQLATDLANRGHQVWVVAPSYGSRDIYRIEQKVRVYRFSSFEWPTYEDLRIAYLPFFPVRRLLKKADPDVIHIHSPVVLGNIAQILAGGLRKPVIVTNHYLPINFSHALTTDPVLGRPFNTVTYSYLVHFCNRCEYVTAPSATALNLLYEHGLRAPARTISNGIDLTHFRPGPPDEELRQRLNLPADGPLILSLNRLSQEKRIDVIIEAVSKMRQPAYLAIAGSGPVEEELRARVDAQALHDRVGFLGFVSDLDLVSLYRLADIFGIASEADLQSLTTMNALACGLPVVAANSYALPELVHHAVNGFLFAPGDSAEMAGYLDHLVSDARLRQSMGAQSLEIIVAHDRVRVLEEWETLYRRLSNEFREARERRLRLRLARKIPRHRRPAAHVPQIVRTGPFHGTR